jgi:hypothetical protein
MATEIVMTKRLSLTFNKGTFGLTKFKLGATPAQLYALAEGINELQDEPFEEVRLTTKSRIM